MTGPEDEFAGIEFSGDVDLYGRLEAEALNEIDRLEEEDVPDDEYDAWAERYNAAQGKHSSAVLRRMLAELMHLHIHVDLHGDLDQVLERVRSLARNQELKGKKSS